MSSLERIYEDRDTTGSCGAKEPVKQPGQVEGTIGLSSRDCPAEVHQDIFRGSHDSTSGSVLGPVGQPNLSKVDSVLSLKGPNNKVPEMTEQSHAAFIEGSCLGYGEQRIRKERISKVESSRDCPDKILEYNTGGSHASTYGTGLGLVRQSTMRKDERLER